MTNSTAADAHLRIQDWLNTARQRLAEALARSPAGQPVSEHEPEDLDGVHAAALETQLLLGHVIHKPRAWIIAHPEAPIDRGQQALLAEYLEKRLNGTPLPYLLGHWEFYGLDFEVTPAVLIPRPETELLVERALDHLGRNPESRSADVGTGSGCIAISLLKNAPSEQVIAVDVSRAALQVAKRNAARHSVQQRLVCIQGSLLSSLTGPFDLVCANLPYIPRSILQGLDVARHEPVSALDGGEDGLDAIRQLAADSPRWLAPGGRLLLEMQFDQGDAILNIVRHYLPSARAEVLHDLAGKPRLVEVNNSTL